MELGAVADATATRPQFRVSTGVIQPLLLDRPEITYTSRDLNLSPADNQVIVTVPSTGTLTSDLALTTSPLSVVSRNLFDLMDRWLAAIAADQAPGTRAQKAVRNKPAALVDSCYDASLQKITNAAACSQLFPYSKDPRLVAGAPATDDVFKCALKAVDAADYKPALDASQLAAVRAAFPSGVCDFTKAPAERVPLADTWLSFPAMGTFTKTDH